MLNISDASMHHLETVGGCTRGEIFTFDQRGVETTQRSLARSGSTGSAAAYNEYIEQFVTEPTQIAADAMCLFHQSIIAKIGPSRAVGHSHCCIGAGLLSDIRTCAQ